MMKTISILVLSAALISCDPGSEAAFTANKSLVSCLQNIPVCADFFARCELNSTTYAQVRFPDDSPFIFLVSALPRETIEISMYWVTQQDAGLDTRVLWYEPGCSDAYEYSSEGLNLFELTEDTNDVFTIEEQIFEGGDHPIEINSDLRGVVDIAVRVLIPGQS